MIVLERCSLLAFWLLRLGSGSYTGKPIVWLEGGYLSRLLKRACKISKDYIARGRIFASFVSVRVTEALLDHGEGDARIQQALLMTFDDQNVLFAYRKGLAQWVEERMGLYEAALQEANKLGCTEVFFVPADPQSARVLHRWKSLQRTFPPERVAIIENRFILILGSLRALLWTWILGVGLLGRVAILIGRQGLIVRKPQRQPFLVAIHNCWNASSGRSWNHRSVDFLVDGRTIHRRDILAIFSRLYGDTRDEQRQINDRRKREYTEAGIAWAELSGPPVPIALLPNMVFKVLQALMILWLPTPTMHQALRRRAMGIVLYGLQLEIFLQHYALGALLNVEEHSSEHVVETVVLNKYGGRTVWIQHNVVRGDGFYSSFLHYNLLPVQGWLQVEVYGKTWSPLAAIRPVGIASNDGACLPDEKLASEPVRRLVQDLKAGSKLVGAFTGSFSSDPHIVERNLRFLQVLSELVRHEPDLKIIIKPKASPERPQHSYFLFEEPFRSVIAKGVTAQRIVILDPRQGLTCTAQYLMNAADCIVSTGQYYAFGSVWVEALLLGKPSYAFAPSEFRFSPMASRFFDRWLFDDVEKITQVVRESLRGGLMGDISSEIRHWFDPFGDRQAIERLRMEIMRLVGEDHRLRETV